MKPLHQRQRTNIGVLVQFKLIDKKNRISDVRGRRDTEPEKSRQTPAPETPGQNEKDDLNKKMKLFHIPGNFRNRNIAVGRSGRSRSGNPAPGNTPPQETLKSGARIAQLAPDPPEISQIAV